MSGQAAYHPVYQLPELGTLDLLFKPFNLAELREALRELARGGRQT
jgi:hypothetical protein